MRAQLPRLPNTGRRRVAVVVAALVIASGGALAFDAVGPWTDVGFDALRYVLGEVGLVRPSPAAMAAPSTLRPSGTLVSEFSSVASTPLQDAGLALGETVPERTSVSSGSAASVSRPALSSVASPTDTTANSATSSTGDGSAADPAERTLMASEPLSGPKAKGRARLTDGSASAEVVDASPEGVSAPLLDGGGFVPPEPIAATSPLPRTVSPEGHTSRWRVFLNVNVQSDGSPGAIQIVDAPRDDRSVSEAVVAAVEQWRFQPARLDGEQVASRVLLVFEQR